MDVEWLASVKPLMSNEEYVRLKYNTIIERILNALNDDIDAKHSTTLLCDHLNVLLRAFEYNRKHPSPQRSLTLQQISVMVNRLVVNAGNDNNNIIKISEEINAQNLLVKCLKCGIKDTIGEQEDENSAILMVDICVKFVAYLKCQKLLLKTLTTLNASSTVIALNHLMLNTLRSVYLLLSKFKITINLRDVNTFCGDILGILKVYAFYCFPGNDMTKIVNTSIYASPLSQFVTPIDNMGETSKKCKASKSKARNKRKSKNHGKRVDVEIDDNEDQLITKLSLGLALSPSNTSESELSSSDYECGYGVNSITNKLLNIEDINVYQRSVANKIRFIAYECLTIITDKFDKRTIFGFWSSFIADDSSAQNSSSQLTVMLSILRDPCDKVRSSALKFLIRFLITGEQFVPTLAADDTRSAIRLPSKLTSFTTISQSLAEMVKEIHCGLSLLLVTESNTKILNDAFKCASLLIAITPYNKLRSGLLTTILYKTLFVLNNKDIQIQKCCLAFACSVCELEPIPEELKQWLSSADGSVSMKRLLLFNVESIHNPHSIILCGESLKLLTTILRPKLCSLIMNRSTDFGVNIWQILEIALKCCDYDIAINNSVVQNLVCKYLYAIGVCLKIILTNEENKSSIDMNNEENINKCKNWWISIMKSQLLSAGLKSDLNVKNNSVSLSSKYLLIDFLSTICCTIFESLTSPEKYYLISILFSVSNSPAIDDLSCHSSAVRCLAVYQSFPSMTEDLSYLCDVSNVSVEIINNYLTIYSNRKESQTLLNQCTWSLANFSDIIRKNYINNSEDISDAFLLNLLNSVLIAFDIEIQGVVGDNITTNLVRSGGCICYVLLSRQSTHDLLSHDILTKNLESLIEKLLHYITNSKYFKLQWNVCNVFSYVLSIDVFLKFCCKTSRKSSKKLMINEIYSTLLTVIKNTRNYKVQCFAVNAICTPNDYYFFDDCCDNISLCSLWCDLVTILINNYRLVPNNIRSNWFNNFYSGIKKLLLLMAKLDSQCFRNNNDIKQCWAQFSDFLSNCDECIVNIDYDMILTTLNEIL